MTTYTVNLSPASILLTIFSDSSFGIRFTAPTSSNLRPCEFQQKELPKETQFNNIYFLMNISFTRNHYFSNEHLFFNNGSKYSSTCLQIWVKTSPLLTNLYNKGSIKLI
ncbi:hypothetical protein ACB094_03G092100 [Castanea mollissima]